VFATFGDLADYSLVQGGSFEGPSAGWSFNNASVVSGEQPLAGPGRQLLSIAQTGEATSPTFCLSSSLTEAGGPVAERCIQLTRHSRGRSSGLLS
jgi:hypothetical protein